MSAKVLGILVLALLILPITAHNIVFVIHGDGSINIYIHYEGPLSPIPVEGLKNYTLTLDAERGKTVLKTYFLSAYNVSEKQIGRIPQYESIIDYSSDGVKGVIKGYIRANTSTGKITVELPEIRIDRINENTTTYSGTIHIYAAGSYTRYLRLVPRNKTVLEALLHSKYRYMSRGIEFEKYEVTVENTADKDYGAVTTMTITFTIRINTTGDISPTAFVYGRIMPGTVRLEARGYAAGNNTMIYEHRVYAKIYKDINSILEEYGARLTAYWIIPFATFGAEPFSGSTLTIEWLLYTLAKHFYIVTPTKAELSIHQTKGDHASLTLVSPRLSVKNPRSLSDTLHALYKYIINERVPASVQEKTLVKIEHDPGITVLVKNRPVTTVTVAQLPEAKVVGLIPAHTIVFPTTTQTATTTHRVATTPPHPAPAEAPAPSQEGGGYTTIIAAAIAVVAMIAGLIIFIKIAK